MLRVLLSRVKHAAYLSQQRMSGAQARKEKLFNLTQTGRGKMSPEQLKLVQNWQEEYDRLEQGLEQVDAVLHGLDADANDDMRSQSFLSEASSVFRFQL
jgi:hypothetical protein